MENELLRYQKQMLYEKIGEEGQKRLLNGRIAIIGCGALGSAIANLMVRAGVGFVRIIDRDFAELHNLQRQVLLDEDDVQSCLPKSVAAKRHLRMVNGQVQIEPEVADFDSTNAERFLYDVDVVLDGTDNFETRFLINDACAKLKRPWVYGACVGSYGLTMTIVPGQTPCLRCVFESMPALEKTSTCDTAGILAPIAQTIAAVQSTEALKILTGNLSEISRSLYSLDIWTRHSQLFNLEGLSDGDCPVCKQQKFDYLSGDDSSSATVLCGRNMVQIRRAKPIPVDLNLIALRLKQIGEVKVNSYLLQAKLDSYEVTLFFDGRAIIQGTSDPVEAKSIYAKYIGL